MLSVPVLSRTTTNSQAIQDLLVLIFALQMVAGFGGDLQRRQTDPCLTTSCSWLTAIDACSSSDTACICAAFVTGSSNVSTCVSCEQAVNATFAFEILTLYQDCASTASTTSTASSVGPAPVPAQAPAGTADPCLLTSCSWLSGTVSCSVGDTACICAVFTSAGAFNVSACVSCEQSVNATSAQEIAAVVQDCATSSSPAPLITSSVAGAPPHTTSATTSTTSTISITSPTRSGSGSIQEQIKGGIWIGVITLSAIVVGLVGLV